MNSRYNIYIIKKSTFIVEINLKIRLIVKFILWQKKV